MESQTSHLPGDRALAAWEIVSVLSSVLLAEWVVYSVGGGSNLLLCVPVGILFAFMFVSHRLRGESARDLGFRLDNFARAARLLALPTLFAAAFLVCAGWLASSINFTRWGGGQSLFGVPALGIFWGLLQQYALQGFINRRAQVIWGRGWLSVLVVALVFGALHLPNPWLTLATFCGGLLWAWDYQRAPNLIALALSHSLMTAVLVTTVPYSSLGGMRVGYGYFL